MTILKIRNILLLFLLLVITLSSGLLFSVETFTSSSPRQGIGDIFSTPLDTDNSRFFGIPTNF